MSDPGQGDARNLRLMKSPKKQIWLRPDQVELTVNCLKFVQSKLDEDFASGAFSKVAGPFTYRRITEILALFDDKP